MFKGYKHPTSFILDIRTRFFKLTKKQEKSHNLYLCNSDPLKPQNLFHIDIRIVCTLRHEYTSSQTHPNSELHHKPPFLHILTKNFKLPFPSCVSWLFSFKSFLTSNTNHPCPCYTTVTPFPSLSKLKNRCLQLDFSRTFQAL